jgi:tRNA pseudouridine13 synthase
MLIKQSPEDFFVEEIPVKRWDDDGPFAVFKLTKISLNTEQAVEIISRRFHIIKSTIKYSGTKDKHAHTIQYISIPNRHDVIDIRLDEENLKLEHVGYSDEPLSLGTLKGNRFIITVRDLEEKELKAIKGHKKNNDKFIMPNYFDEQRFSSNNYNIGLSILKKDYKNAVKYMCESSDIFADTITIYMAAHPNDYVGSLQRIPKKTLLMFIHSVQSFMFNEALYKILMENAIKNSIEYYLVPYSIGNFVFYKNMPDYGTVFDSKETSLELIGFNSLTMNHNIKHLMDELSLTQRDFIVRALPDLSVEGTTRECFIEIQNFEKEILDNRIILEFELPKGSYATIAVKMLFNCK